MKPAPLTTIAWRLCHLTDVLAGERNATWIGASPVGKLDKTGEPATAHEAIELLEKAFDLFRRNVEAADPETLTEPMGRIAGFYAKDTRAAFVLHELDELVHHGSEIAAMRDMYRATRQTDPFVAACLGGDLAAAADLARKDPGPADPARRADRGAGRAPALGRRAAARGAGFRRQRVGRRHRTALRGGCRRHRPRSVAARPRRGPDDQGHRVQPPCVEWARFYDRDDVAKYLE
jgi:hypothetical protein